MGAALLSRGFRPFFQGAALWAVIAIGVWPFVFARTIEIPTAFSPMDWHAHEMIFGYVAAVMAGLPVSGWSLVGLTALWTAGRLAVCESTRIGRPLAAAIDCAFLAVFAVLVAREVLAGKNWRNAKVVAFVAILAGANVAYHCEHATTGAAEYSQRAALGLIVMLILVVGGRVTPSSTSSWLGRRGATKRPAPFAKPDSVVMAVSGLALIAWTAAPDNERTGLLAISRRTRQPLAAFPLARPCRSPRRAGRRPPSRIRVGRDRLPVFRRQRALALENCRRRRRACLSDRRGRPDDVGDDNAGDPRTRRTCAGRLDRDEGRLRLNHDRAIHASRDIISAGLPDLAAPCRRMCMGRGLRGYAPLLAGRREPRARDT